MTHAALPLPSPPIAGGSPFPGEHDTIHFPAGIPGFERHRRFVVLAVADQHVLHCLTAVDPPGPSFITIDPALVDPAYDKRLRTSERATLGASDDPLLWLALVTVGPDGATANLRAPIVVDVRRMVGCQLIRDESPYGLHVPVGALPPCS